MVRVLALAALAVAGCSFGSGGGAPGSYPMTGQGSGTGGTGSTSTGAAGNSGVVTGAAGGGNPTGAGGSIFGPGGAGSTGAAGNSTGSAGSMGATGAAGSSADGGTVQCIVGINPLAPVPGSFANLETGQTLRLQASVSGVPGALAVHWTWLLKMTGVSSVADLPYTRVDDSTIELTLGAPGTYQVNASIDGAPSCDRAPVIFSVNSPEVPTLRFRVTPPASAQLPVRELTVKTMDLATTPSLDLGDARSSALVTLNPVDTQHSFPIPSYVRITNPSSGLALEGYTGQGAMVAPLSTSLTYDVLIIPDGGLAPLLVSGLPDAITKQMTIAPGASITGVMRDAMGNPVSGARVLLQAGARPSTVGTSGADGTFTLTTREGSLSADIVPPAGSGLPEARVAASPGIVLLASMSSLDLSMDWAKVPASALTIAVTGTGAAPVAGARVRVDLATPIANAGTLRVNGATAAQLQATGTAYADGVTDAQGAAHLGLLPNGLYHVIVAPPDGASSVAITLADVTVPTTGAAASIALSKPMTLSGTLTAPSGVSAGALAGAKVTAIDRAPLAAPTMATATAGADGKYMLPLAAGRTYELLVEPDPTLGLARWVVGRYTPQVAVNTRADVLPPAIAWKGSVTGSGRVVAGALVQVYCSAPATWCADPGLVLTQGTTATDGSITLALPGSQ